MKSASKFYTMHFQCTQGYLDKFDLLEMKYLKYKISTKELS